MSHPVVEFHWSISFPVWQMLKVNHRIQPDICEEMCIRQLLLDVVICYHHLRNGGKFNFLWLFFPCLLYRQPKCHISFASVGRRWKFVQLKIRCKVLMRCTWIQPTSWTDCKDLKWMKREDELNFDVVYKTFSCKFWNRSDIAMRTYISRMYWKSWNELRERSHIT